MLGMDFYTVNCKLSIEGTTLKQTYLTGTLTHRIILSLFILGVVINSGLDKLAIAQESGKVGKYISLVLPAVVVLMYAGILFVILFRLYWWNKIDISSIERIRVVTGEVKGLETRVVVTLKSRRYKPFHFRTLENQVAVFVDALCAVNPTIEVERVEAVKESSFLF
jgi:hypothetical protein